MATCLDAALATSQVLEQIFSKSFGPNGLDIALKTETGCILVTNSGQEILNSISLAHPVGRLIANQVNAHVHVTGDNSKLFIMILTEFIRHVNNNVIVQSTAGNVSSTLAGLSNACAVLSRLIYNGELITVLKQYCKPCVDNHEDFDKRVRGLSNTALMGRFSPHVVNIMTDNIVKLIMYDKNSQLMKSCFENVANLVENFHDICIQVHGVGISNSAIKDGFVFPQEPIGRNNELINTKFICINHSFDFEEIEFATVYMSLDEQKLGSMTQLRIKFINKLSNLLQKNHIEIILCSSNLPDYAASILSMKYCILQNVDEEDLGRICSNCGIRPVESLEEFFEEDLKNYVGYASHGGSILFGNRKFFNIVIDQNAENNRPYFQFILCAPSTGICQQYYKEIHKVLKVIKIALYENYGSNTNGSRLLCLPGGGAAEFYISKYFGDIARNSDDYELKLVSGCLSQAFLSIPRWLHKNSNNSSENLRFVNVLNQLHEKLDVDDKILHGIDGNSGYVFDPLESNIVEPYSSKILFVNHLLQAAQQILKIDAIIPSKTKSASTNTR